MLRQSSLRLHPWLETPLARWLLAIVWMGIIFYLSSQSTLPMPDDPWINFVLRKIAHFVAFGILALLLWRALPPGRWVYVWSWVLTTLYACSDEYHQSFVALRQPAVRDVIIDSCGAVATLLLIWYVSKQDRQRAVK